MLKRSILPYLFFAIVLFAAIVGSGFNGAPAMASGSIYYVATTGNNSNLGTSDAPFLTIAKGVSAAGPGDTVIVKSGSYIESVNLGTKSGTSSAYIVIKSEVVGGAKIDTTSLGSGYGLEAFFGSPVYIEINGFEISAGANSSGIYFDSGHHTRIINNIVHNAGASGIQTNHGDYRIIEGNKTYLNAFYMTYAGSGISLWQASKADANPGFHNILRNNISYSNDNLDGTAKTDGNGIIIDDFRNTQSNSTLGVYTPATLVENNLAYNNGGRGIEIFLSDNVTIRNNTVNGNSRRNDTGTWRGELYAANSSDLTFVNNISVTDSSINSNNKAILIGNCCSQSMANIIWRNNLTYDTNKPGDASYLIDTSTTEVPSAANGNKLGVDPIFVNSAGYDFHIQSTSPALNAGTSAFGTGSYDLDGNTRVVGTIDMGAYELPGTAQHQHQHQQQHQQQHEHQQQ